MEQQLTRTDAIRRFRGGAGTKGRPSLWRSVSLAVLLVVTLSLGVVSQAQAQSADKEISGLTLRSDSPGTLAISWDAPGTAPYGYRVNWAKSSENFPSWRLNAGNAYPSSNSLTLTGLVEGETYKVRVRARYDDGQGAWSATVTKTVKSTPGENFPATGAPTISGEAEVGRTLTAGTSGISDDNGMSNVSYRYRWIAGDSPIEGATGNTYTLVDADEGKTIKVRVSFTDDDDYEESVTSASTTAVKAAKTPLTAEIELAPVIHDGASSFEVRIRFSERLKNRRLGSKVVRVTNGDNTASSRVGEDGEVWAITIQPDGDDDVTIKLVAGANDKCGSGLACTTDMRPLSEDLLYIVRTLDSLDEVVLQRELNFNTPITQKPVVDIMENCVGEAELAKLRHHYHTRGTLTTLVPNADYYELRWSLWGQDPWTTQRVYFNSYPFDEDNPIVHFDLRFRDSPAGYLKCGIELNVNFRGVNANGPGPWSNRIKLRNSPKL